MEWSRGERIAIGPHGSGTRQLALELFDVLGVGGHAVELLDLPTFRAADQLLRGEIDGMVVVTAFESPVVQRLLRSPEVNTASFARADAHVALRPYLSKLALPQGVADLRTNRPPHDVTLVAPKASLVVRGTLHPAAQYLLLQAAAEVHARPALFHQAGQFPAPEPIDVPISASATQYYKVGSPLLQRLLPYWGAALVSGLLTLLIPLIALAYPLLKMVPGVYDWGMRRRIFRLYGELKFLEAQLETRTSADAVDDLQLALDGLEGRANHMRTPTAFAHMIYTLRMHIRLVRDRLARRAPPPGGP